MVFVGFSKFVVPFLNLNSHFIEKKNYSSVLMMPWFSVQLCFPINSSPKTQSSTHQLSPKTQSSTLQLFTQHSILPSQCLLISLLSVINGTSNILYGSVLMPCNLLISRNWRHHLMHLRYNVTQSLLYPKLIDSYKNHHPQVAHEETEAKANAKADGSDRCWRWHSMTWGMRSRLLMRSRQLLCFVPRPFQLVTK